MARRRRSQRRPAGAPGPAGHPQTAPAPRNDRTIVVVAVGVAVAAAALGLYIRTAAQDLTFGDAPELTGAAVTLGVAHPPGYPIWTVLAHVFTLVPIGTPSFRVSILSVVAAVACLTIVYATAYRLSHSVIGAATAAALLALTPVVWTWSVVPEVFALNDLLAASLIGLLLAWHLDRKPRLLLAAAFVGGLGMANQQTIALLGPAALYLMWSHRRSFAGMGLFLRTGGAFAAGLLPYAYLPFAASHDPAWNWGDISSAGDLAGHILRTTFGTGQLVSSSLLQGGSAGGRLLLFASSFDLALAALAALGATVLLRRDRTLFWFVAVAFAAAGPAFIAYSNVRIDLPVTQAALERFFLLPQVVVAPLVAVGFADAVSRARRQAISARSIEVAVAVSGVAAAVVVAAIRFAAIDQSENHDARHFAEDILATARSGAIVLANGDAAIMTVGYLRTIEGARPDVTFIQAPLLTGDWYVRQLGRRSPNLVLHAASYDVSGGGTMRDLVEPNGPDRFDIVGGLLDDSVNQTYGFVRRGLAQELHRIGEPLSADALASVNDQLLRSYRIPDAAAVSARPWDALIVADYAFIAYDVGQVYERGRTYAQARDWYARALAIDPDLIEAQSALARLPKAP